FEHHIRPLFDSPLVDYVGEIDEHEKTAFLSGALALLFPIDWPEPFGLVMIEAMACGTPVIAFPFGSVREVVEDGVTGFIVDNEAQAVGAVHKVDQL
ncbi:glycosyltransferase, partial [Pseudomonas viridiflava]